MRTLTSVVAAIAACGLTSLTAPPALGGGPLGINMDAQPHNQIGGKPASSYGAAAGQEGFWNTLNATGPAAQSMFDLSGSPAGVTVTRFSNALANATCVGGIVNINWSGLMCDYAWDVAGVVNHIEYEFKGLPAGAYQVYTYACQPGETFAPNSAVALQLNGQFVPGSAKSIGGTVLNQQFVEGKTHVVHSITLEAGDALRVVVYDTSGEFGDEVAVNGIQIVPIGDPEALITSPDFLNCACSPVEITGTATATGGALDHYTLDWSSDGNAPWTTIATGSTPVVNNVLASWNAQALPEGYYVIRLTVVGQGGSVSTATTTVYLDKSFDPLTISPQDGQVLGGGVCIGGTIWDLCFDSATIEYRNAGAADPYAPIDPAMPFYTQPVINQTMDVWATDAGPTAVPDGLYNIRITGFTECGNAAEVIRTVTIDNTAPKVEIDAPPACLATGCGPVKIIGSVFDENLEGWFVQYTGADDDQWVTIASGSANVDDDVLATFDPTGLPACCYTFRVIAHDKAIVDCNGAYDNRTEKLVTVKVGLEGDVNGDNVVDSQDLNLILGSFGLGCF